MRPTHAFVIAAGLLLPGIADAQTPPAEAPPARVGDQWNNQEHPPSRAENRQEEQAAGLRGSPAQENRATQKVEQLDRQILERAQQGRNDGVMNGTAATKPMP